MGHFEAYLICLEKISSLFFTFNHCNYARWLTKYLKNVYNLNQTHPGLENSFRNGGFGIKRTKKFFSKLPIDLTLEQTINADAANKYTGISAFTNSITARQRWSKSHYLRTSLCSTFFNSLHLNSNDDVSKDLRPNMIKKNNEDLQKLKIQIINCCNPFKTLETPKLFNISSGKSTSAVTSKFLLNIFDFGDNQKNCFITECLEEPQRFLKPIKKNIISNFSKESISTKRETGSSDKLRSVKLERNLFARIIFIAIEKQINMELVLTYPLTPIPLSLCHPDGTPHKTQKSKLLIHIEGKVNSSQPSSIDTIIFDGMSLLHMLSDVPTTYGGLIKHLLNKMFKSQAKEIRLIYDTYLSPSIKDVERNRRMSNRQDVYNIIGLDQKLPRNLHQALQSESFKTKFVNFFVTTLQNYGSNFYSCFNEKILYCSAENECYKFSAIEGEICCENVADLYCEHEEADVKIVFHLSKINSMSQNVVVRAIDTDIMIIILGNMYNFPNLKIYMEVGRVSNNSLRYIELHKLYEHLGSSLCKSLPAFHAFTGCDFSAAFHGKGKIKPFKLLQQNHEFQEYFSALGLSEEVEEDVSSKLENFVCSMYGNPTVTSVNKLRFILFNKLCKYSDKNPLNKIKGMYAPVLLLIYYTYIIMYCVSEFDASMLPPCFSVLYQKIKRVNFITAIWKSAVHMKPPHFVAQNNGWIEKDNSLDFYWFGGTQTPTDVHQILDENESSDEENDEIGIHSSDEEDNTF